MIIQLLVLVIFLGFVCWVINLCKTDYDECYSEMESSGIAVFGECCGMSGGTSSTEYLSEQCVSCPHLCLAPTSIEKGEKDGTEKQS
jgi:hypothetical protein